eukprot:241918_1
MASLFIVASSLLALVVKSQSDVCIWERYNDANSNTHLNGQFRYDGQNSGGATYIKTSVHATCGSTLYIYYNGRWVIGNSKGSNNGWYATCTQLSLTACTAGKWSISGEGTDSRMRLISGSCPYWNCGKVTTNVPDNNNCGSFTQNIGLNAWKASNGYVWHFKPMYWQWWCINSNVYTYQACTGVSYDLTTAQQWQDTSLSQSRTFPIGWTYTSLTSLTVSCLPTTSPTTPKPTPRPVSAPTPRPVTAPSPTPYPVNAPSPTPYPVTNPAYNPAYTSPVTNPANSPVTNPAYNPVVNPVSNPVTNPAYNPVTTPTVSNPAANPGGDDDDNNDDDDDDDDQDGNSQGGDSDVKKGLSAVGDTMKNVWIYIVIGVAVCCCCIIVVVCLIKVKRNRDYKKANEDPYADTVQMNPSDPYGGRW